MLLRSKEDAQDYRYFPEPDLGTLVLAQEHVQQLKDSLPELPGAKVQRYLHEDGLPLVEAELLAESPEKSALDVYKRQGYVRRCHAGVIADKAALKLQVFGIAGIGVGHTHLINIPRILRPLSGRGTGG